MIIKYNIWESYVTQELIKLTKIGTSNSNLEIVKPRYKTRFIY